MKKMTALVLGLVMALALMLSAAGAEGTVFDSLGGLEWCYSSGVGGWSTDMVIREDGSFSGSYHDSEYGESGEGYPNGTVYLSSFSGLFSVVEQVDENTWRLRVEQLNVDEITETIQDGIRFTAAESRGVSAGETFLLYRPGTPVSVLSEEMQFWAHVQDQPTPPEVLGNWFLASETNDCGFEGTPLPLTLDAGADAPAAPAE